MRLDKNDPPDYVEFNGTTYKRMGGERRYYLAVSKIRPKGLHVAIWEHHNGREVPPGHEVHHLDTDTFNCEPANLECLPTGVHRRMPKRIDRPKRLALLDSIRPLSVGWHRSEEGRAWHRENAKTSLRQPRAKKPFADVRGTRQCEECGTSFEYRSPRKVLCSNKCACRRYNSNVLMAS